MDKISTPPTQEEWDKAKEGLSGSKNGTKWSEKEHIFIKLDDQILLMLKILGNGSTGEAQRARNENNEFYVIKTSKRGITDSTQEGTINQDLGISKTQGVSTIEGGVRIDYLLQKFLGEGLKKYLESQDPKNEFNPTTIKPLDEKVQKYAQKRFNFPDKQQEKRANSVSTLAPEKKELQKKYDLAIAVTAAVLNLHSGKHSKSKKGYAHLDLKPENITVDNDDKVHLIDFDRAQIMDSEECKPIGTATYILKKFQATKEQHDCFALLRVFYIPKTYKSPVVNSMTESNRSTDVTMIFSDEQIEKNRDLSDLLDTKSGVLEKVKDTKTLLLSLILLKHEIYGKNKDQIKNLTEHASNALISLNNMKICIDQELFDSVKENKSLQNMLVFLEDVEIKENKNTLIKDYISRFEKLNEIKEYLEKLKNYKEKKLETSSKKDRVEEFSKDVETKMREYLLGDDNAFNNIKNDNESIISDLEKQQSPALALVLSCILACLRIALTPIDIVKTYYNPKNPNFFLKSPKPKSACLAEKVIEEALKFRGNSQ